jgi:hypothetical protein
VNIDNYAVEVQGQRIVAIPDVRGLEPGITTLGTYSSDEEALRVFFKMHKAELQGAKVYFMPYRDVQGQPGQGEVG